MPQNEKQDTYEWRAALLIQIAKRVSQERESWENTVPPVQAVPDSSYPRVYENPAGRDFNEPTGKNKKYERLAEADMTSQSYLRYKAMAQAAGLTGELKIYKDTDDTNGTAPIAKVAYTDARNPVIIINDSEHQYTASYARKLATSDAALEHAVSTGALFKITHENAPAVYDRYAKLATGKDRMNLPYAPDLYVSFHPGINNGTDMARRTQEGRMYTVLEPSDILRGSDKETHAILAHETTHHGDGHTTFEQMARIHNDKTLTLSKTLERQADIDSVSVKGTCQPQALADFLVEYKELAQKDYQNKYPGKSAREIAEMIAHSDPYHPSLTDRIAYLSELAAHPPAACKDHELQTPLMTPQPARIPNGPSAVIH